MRRKTIKRTGTLALAAATLGFVATMFTAAPAHAWCENNNSGLVRGGHDDGPISYRLERWTGEWAHGLNCGVVVPVEQIFAWTVERAF
jgi:hypothetical protein